MVLTKTNSTYYVLLIEKLITLIGIISYNIIAK